MGVNKELTLRKGKGTGKPKATEKGGNFGLTFINFELTERHKTELREFAGNGEISWADCERCILDGYALKISPMRNGDGFAATLSDSNEGSAFNGHAISGRGGTPFNAFASVYYKHYYALSGDWSNAELPSSIDFG